MATFAPSLKLELGYSLLALTDPESRIHAGWRKSSRAALGAAFFRRFEALGGAWQLWPILSTLLPAEANPPGFAELLAALEALPPRSWQEKLLAGALHFPELIASVLDESRSLRYAIHRTPRKKQEWLAFMGLYPYDPNQPLVRAYEALLADPRGFKKELLALLRRYWERVFKRTWEFYRPALERSAAQKERLFASCSFEEFSRAALLRIELDPAHGVIRAARGGYRLRESQIESCVFSPSAFNDRRLWSALKGTGSAVENVVLFPCFDPALQLEPAAAPLLRQLAEPPRDPFLVFRALGDSTRFAIASLIAREPRTATELAQTLEVSKPTISHHLEALRSAGLLVEEPVAGSVRLSLNRDAIEEVGERACRKLFDAGGRVELNLTRNARRR